LLREELEEVSGHVIVVPERLIAMLIVLDELVCKRIDEDTAHRDVAVVPPDPRHTTKVSEVVVGRHVAALHRCYLSTRVAGLPASTIVSIGVDEAAVLALEDGQNLEGNIVREIEDNDCPSPKLSDVE
jgi:hypothetical protein